MTTKHYIPPARPELVSRPLALHQKLAAATLLTDKQLYQRQTWRELAERSRPLTGRLTRWSTSCTS